MGLHRRTVATVRRALPIPRTRILFLHVPKCGGSSIGHALEDHYRSFRSDAAVASLGAESTFDAVMALLGRRPDWDEVHRYRQQRMIEAVQDPAVRLAQGHVQYTDPLLATAQSEGFTTVTLLREPTRRWWSGFVFNRLSGSSQTGHDLDIEAYLETPQAVSAGHYFATYLSGLPSSAPISEHVGAAIVNLGNFNVLGVLEDMIGFTRRLERAVGRRLLILHENASPDPGRRLADQSPAIRAAIEELCAADIAVHAAATALSAARAT